LSQAIGLRGERVVLSWLAQQAYSTLLRLATPAYLWRVWSRGKQEPGYRLRWPERLGFYSRDDAQAVSSREAPLVWVHAVSLGEARAAAPLIQALREALPGMRLLLTHTTATGAQGGQSLLEPGDLQTWLPYDTPGAVRRFLRRFRPSVGVLMETEVWPNLVHEARRAGVPMALANARLSEKSLRQGQRFAALLRPAAQALTVALAQTENDARRLSLMGAQRVLVCGNIKFDMSPSPALLQLGTGWRAGHPRPVVLAASTREGEEQPLLSAWRQATAAAVGGHLRPRLLLVPRHPQRFDEVAELVRSAGLSLSRRSSWAGGQPDEAALAADVWLGDSMGEMPAYYAAARVALLGGSFAPLGGQNLIEAAACGCPVVMGPSTFNFELAADLSEAAGAACRVQGVEEGVRRAIAMLDTGADAQAAAAAQSFACAHRGAARLMANHLKDLLPSP
jgi:3-deoxy-D-manno-octulosonic-acid transferase